MKSTTPDIILSIPDQRMINLIERLTAAGRISTRQEFLDEIGMLKQNYTEVVNGRRSFRVEHIAAACRAYGVNANWILGLEKQIYSERKSAKTLAGRGNSAAGTS